MLELATVCLLLSLGSESVVPGEGFSSVLAPNSVVSIQAHLYIGI
jgi:hypothetical protein